MSKLWLKIKHIFGEHEWECIKRGSEKTGGKMFGGAYVWSTYKCIICGKEEGMATESLF